MKKLLIFASACLAIFCYANRAHAAISSFPVTSSGINGAGPAFIGIQNTATTTIIGSATSSYVVVFNQDPGVTTFNLFVDNPTNSGFPGNSEITFTRIIGNDYSMTFPYMTTYGYYGTYTIPVLSSYSSWMCYETSWSVGGYCNLSLPLGTYWTYDATPPAPTATWQFPTNVTTTPDFSNWEVTIANVTTTDEYKLTVYYSPFGGSITYTDYNLFYPSVSTASVAPVNKSVALASLTTTTAWSAYAYLNDLTEGGALVATSTAITFDVNTATSIYTGIYSTSTFPAPYTPGTLASTSPAFATSTCAWGDVGCAIGNVADNILNFIFGINPAEIQAVAGFNLATQPPFDQFSQISNDFASVSGSTTVAASSSISANLGHGNFNLDFFNPQTAENLFGSAAPVVRNLLLAFLIVLMIYGFYREIKSIFRPHA